MGSFYAGGVMEKDNLKREVNILLILIHNIFKCVFNVYYNIE